MPLTGESFIYNPFPYNGKFFLSKKVRQKCPEVSHSLMCISKEGRAINHEGHLHRYCPFITDAALGENYRQRGVLEISQEYSQTDLITSV